MPYTINSARMVKSGFPTTSTECKRIQLVQEGLVYLLYRIIALVALSPVPTTALSFQVMLRRIGARCSILQLPVVHDWKNGSHRCHARRQRRVRPLRAQRLWKCPYVARRAGFLPRKRRDALPQRRYRREVLRRPAETIVRLEVRFDLASRRDRVPLNRRRWFDGVNAHRCGFR